jgi:hypothetical protein
MAPLTAPLQGLFMSSWHFMTAAPIAASLHEEVAHARRLGFRAPTDFHH